jgi:hypothetical protein
VFDRLDLGLEETERQLEAGDTSHWAELAERAIADCHPDQRAFVLDPGRRVVALVGRGGGKTTGGKARLVRRLLTTPRARCVYIATTRDHAERLIWEPLKTTLASLGLRAGRDVIYNETKLRVTFRRTGAFLWLFGADKPKEIEKLRGLAFHEVHIDEAASYPTGLVEKLITQIIGPRLGDYGGCICLYGTPGAQLSGMFYEVSRPGSTRSRPWVKRDEPDFAGWAGWSFHEWDLAGAIEKLAAEGRVIQALINLRDEQLLEKRTQGWSDDHPIWLRENRGRWAADNSRNVFTYRIHHPETGELWNQWDPPREGPLQIAKLPDTFDDWAHIIALDLGHSDPTAINAYSFSPSDPTRTIYHRLGFEQTKMYAQTIAFKMIGEALNHGEPDGIIGALGDWPNAMVADSAHQMAAAILAELANVYGVRIEPAQKGYKYKYGAIEVVNGDLFDGRIKVLKGSLLETQLLDLQWALDKFEQQVERKDQPNHSTDTLIYARAAITHLITAGSVAPSERRRAHPHDPGYEPPTGDEPRDEYGLLAADDYSALMR